MPIDPTIALQVKPVALNDPMEMFGKMQTLKHLDQQNQLLGLQQQQLGDTIRNNNGVRAVFGDPNNFDTDELGQRVLKPEKRAQLWSIDHKVANEYDDNVLNNRTKLALAQKEKTAQVLQQFQIDEKRHGAAIDEAIGLMHVFNSTLQKYGGDPTEPYKNPIALQTAEAEVERMYRPQARQRLIDAHLLDPNSPETPFTYGAYSQIAAQKEKFGDLQARELTKKLNKLGHPFEDVDGYQAMMMPDGTTIYARDDAGNKIKTAEKFSPPVNINDLEGKPAGAASIGGRGTVIPIDLRLDKGKGEPKPSQAEQKAIESYGILSHANDALDRIGMDTKRPNGRVVKGITKMPFSAGLIDHSDNSLWTRGKNAAINSSLSSEEQQYKQAADEFVTKLGYHWSGAALRKEEGPGLHETYIGQFGDGPAVLKAKAEARKNVVELSKTMGGAGAEALQAQRLKDQAKIDEVRRQETQGGAQGGAPATGGRQQLIYDPTKKTMVPAPVNQGGASGSWDAAPAAAPAAPTAAPTAAPAGPYGKREDGTEKGEGYFGTIPRADGSDKVSGELSVGVNINGKETLIPTMVPTLTKPELDFLLSADKDAIFDKKNPTAVGIMDKAVAFAKQRLSQGKSVWAEPGEKYPMPGTAAPKFVSQDPAPKELLQYLREGTKRRVKVDGVEQIWTLENGQPKRVQ